MKSRFAQRIWGESKTTKQNVVFTDRRMKEEKDAKKIAVNTKNCIMAIARNGLTHFVRRSAIIHPPDFHQTFQKSLTKTVSFSEL